MHSEVLIAHCGGLALANSQTPTWLLAQSPSSAGQGSKEEEQEGALPC